MSSDGVPHLDPCTVFSSQQSNWLIMYNNFFQHMGSKDDFQAKIEEQTSVRLDQISESVKKNQDKVIERLLSLVYDIKPELHQNLRT